MIKVYHINLLGYDGIGIGLSTTYLHGPVAPLIHCLTEGH